jgi:hypothetical protein
MFDSRDTRPSKVSSLRIPTHFADDLFCELIDFAWQSKSGQSNREIDAFFAIINTRVGLLERE